MADEIARSSVIGQSHPGILTSKAIEPNGDRTESSYAKELLMSKPSWSWQWGTLKFWNLGQGA
jgi:hypothetical protein